MSAFASLAEQYWACAEYDDEKLAILREIEELIGVSGVGELLAEVIANENEYDLARIEALEIVRANELGVDSGRAAVGEAIRTVLAARGDVLVRQYAASAAFRFLGVDGVLACVGAVLKDSRDDVDVRFNALGAVQRGGAGLNAVGLLREIRNDSTLGNAVSDVLRLWGVGEA